MKRIVSLLLICLMLTSVAFAGNTTFVDYTTVTEDGVTTVTATALANGSDEVKLYTAVYDANGNLAGAKEAFAKDGNLLKNSVTLGEGQTIKSFAWEGDKNTPVEKVATYNKAIDEADVEITFGGKSFEEFVGSALAFDDTDHIAQYNVAIDESKIGSDGNITIPYPEVKLYDNAFYYDVNVDEKNYTATIRVMSGRDVTYDEAYVSKAKETYAPKLCETIVINYKMAMFTEDMIKELSDTFVDFNGNKTSYDNIYTYDIKYADEEETVVENSPAIQGKTAVLSAISVDGVALQGFSPDVFEYNLTVDAAQVVMPAVTYVAAGDAVATKTDTYTFPGKTEIAVTEGDTTNTYTINYIFPEVKAEVVAMHSALADVANNQKPAYSPNFDVGSRAFTDRSYTVTSVVDELKGVDRIEIPFDWEYGDNTKYPEFKAGTITDWFSFRTVRGATVIILDDSPNAKKWLKADDGWKQEASDTPYVTFSLATLTYVDKFSKHFDAGEKIDIPGYKAGTRGYTILIKYDDWADPMQAANDITITADKFSKSTIVVLVPHDKTKDTLVAKNAGGEYSPVVWTEDKSAATDAYNYERDAEGNILYNGYKDTRATGKRYNSDIVTMTSGTTAVTTEAFKQLTENDGHYVYGSQVAANRYPKAGNRMTLINVPDEYEGSNGIVYNFSGSGHTNVTLNFSANTNLDKVVIMSLDAITNLKANGEAVFTQTVPATEDQAYYMYQGITSGKPATAEFTMSYHIAKGNMYDYDISSVATTNVTEGYTYYIERRAIADFLKINTVGPDANKMPAELYAIATTAERDSWQKHKWFFGDVVFLTSGALVENLTFMGPATHESVRSSGEVQIHNHPDPKILDFTLGAYSDRVDNVTSATGNKAGEPLSYPAWLELANATYIAGAYEWTSLPGCNAADFENINVATDWYTFEVAEDATVMMFVRNAPANFWATESEGWSKTVLTGDDLVNICRTKTGSARFEYNNLFVKDVKKGDTVVIKSPQMKGIIPLVFVKSAK